MNDQLKEKLKSLPAAPGVYFHKNAQKEVIYVGKAAVLKNRVKQYFHKNAGKDRKTAELVKEIADTDWIVTDSEMDALFLESEMVKRYKPKWNILLRDDKSVSYVRIDLKNPIPYVTLTRDPADDKAEYFGPYYGQAGVKKALKVLRKVFPYYDKPFNGKKSLYTDLNLTPGIEIGKTTKEEYKKSLRHLIQYLKGNRKKLIKDLEKEMNQAAKAEDFETAANLRNQLSGLRALATKIIFSDQEFMDISNDEALRELQNLLNLENPPKRIEGFDISHQSGTNVVASNVVFINGASDKRLYKRFKIKEDKNNDFANMREVIERRLKHLNDWGRPDVVLIDGGEPQLRAVRDLLENAKIPYIGLAKEFETIILPTGEAKNLGKDSHLTKLLQRIRDESHRFAVQYHTLLKRKNTFK